MNQNKIKIIAVLLLLCISAAWLAKYEIQESGQNLSGQMADKMKQNTDEPQNLYAQSAVLMDADSGRILAGKDADTAYPMASTTKILTCILALEQGNPDDWVEVSEKAASMPDVQLNMRAGERYRLSDLLYSLMLESHNDSAVAVAEHIGGSVEEFAEKMNRKAREIGCKNVCFVTPNGLDVADVDGNEHSASAADMARIMRYCAFQSPCRETFLEITRTASRTIQDESGNRSFYLANHNALLSQCAEVLSGKTGFTGKAGYCYVAALKKEGKAFTGGRRTRRTNGRICGNSISMHLIHITGMIYLTGRKHFRRWR